MRDAIRSPVVVAVVALTLAAACVPEDGPTPRERDAGAAGTAPSAGDRLSALGLFRDVAALDPAPGVLAYDVRHPQWKDGARAVRHLRLPEGGRVRAGDDGSLLFPAGTLIARTFRLDRPPAGRAHGRLETQVLEKRATGTWQAATYVWTAAGTDAARTDGRPRELDVELPAGGARYRVEGVTACNQCHAGARDHALGLTGWQLGSPLQKELVARGHLEPGDLPLPRASVRGRDDVERRALAYLAANCGSCHAPRSPDFLRNGLDLRHWRAKRSLVRKRPARFATGDVPFRVTPGRPRASVAYRLLLGDLVGAEAPNGRMPPVGCSTVDEEGARLLREWIASLE